MQLSSAQEQSIERYLAGTATDEDLRLVNEWFYSFRDEETEVLTDEQITYRELKEAMKRNVMALTGALPRKTGRVRRLITGSAAAALITGALAIGLHQNFNTRPAPVQKVLAAASVPPGFNRAVLTLGDGTVVQLDSAGRKTMHQQGAAVMQQGGQLHYKAEQQQGFTYNTLHTPRGGQFAIRLADGSQVWLNASSSIRFPTSFQDNKRKVEITGEAYFEIAQDASKPFIVQVKDGPEVEVLGTKFNINAYENEGDSKTTLLQGAVRVRSGKYHSLLQPGQQALVSGPEKPVTVLPNINTSQAIAWKEGLFNVQDLQLEEIMRLLARWYDFEVVYRRKLPALRFSGEIGRTENLGAILDFLTESSGLRFSLTETNGEKLLFIE